MAVLLPRRWLARSGVLVACCLPALLSGCGSSEPAAGPAVDPAALVLKAETVLPPGQSGFVSLAGQAQGMATGVPADYGPHLDDQRPLYWSFEAKPAVLGSKPGTPSSPKAGVEVYRDGYGVPIVYAGNVRDLWYGVGHAIAEDRLFLMDAVRRTAKGTLAELTGCGAVPADLQQRVIGYTQAEYQQFFDALSPDARDAIEGYVEGANARIAEVQANPSLLPAEYALLTSTPAPLTALDVLASGVYITRFVASEGGNEFLNIRLLKALSQRYGSARAGKDAFLDLTWLDDPKAVTSVPASAGRFSNQALPAEGRDAAFEPMADWALTLPETIWKGEGTGHAAAPFPCAQPSLPMAANASDGLNRAARREVQIARATPPALRATSPARRGGKASPPLRSRGGGGAADGGVKLAPRNRPAIQRQVALALNELRSYLHGGSHAYALAPSRTRDGGTLLVSGPQLGYGYPLLLVEYEIHGAGYHARGSSVPGLPVVGIGYTEHAAWGLTTGYSKTVDSFIETICSTAQIAAGSCGADQYFHQNQWKAMDCRGETLNYRAAQQGVPVGLPVLSSTAKVCRTVHGPIVARDDAAGLARSLSYAMWGREIETIEGIREWNRAKTFAEFDAAMRKVTWNENTTVATRDGHIAFYHPGLHAQRNAHTDQRLPIPGSGAYDHLGLLPFEQTPQLRDPAQGYLANWNNKPALGWLDGEGLGNTSRPGGPGQRVTVILDRLASRSDWSFADLKDLDRHTGTTDPRAREYRPLIAAFRASAATQLSEVERAALDRVLAWDGSHYGPDIEIDDEAATDSPGATIFGALVLALRDELFGALREDVLDSGLPDPDPNNPNAEAGLSAYGRIAGVGSHVFDQSVMDNLTVRVLDPFSSGLVNRRDWAQGRDRNTVMLAALRTALARLATSYNGGAALGVAELDRCRRLHPRSRLCSLSGVIGPGSDTVPGTNCVTMPYQDRGSWVHRVGYERP